MTKMLVPLQALIRFFPSIARNGSFCPFFEPLWQHIGVTLLFAHPEGARQRLSRVHQGFFSPLLTQKGPFCSLLGKINTSKHRVWFVSKVKAKWMLLWKSRNVPNDVIEVLLCSSNKLNPNFEWFKFPDHCCGILHILWSNGLSNGARAIQHGTVDCNLPGQEW